jgi:hypothetical protein
MQSSQALQQPSNTVHHQQVASPEAARAAAESEAQQHAKQVNESEKTENEGIREEEEGNRRNREGESPSGRKKRISKGQDRTKGASEPGKGERLDLLA